MVVWGVALSPWHPLHLPLPTRYSPGQQCSFVHLDLLGLCLDGIIFSPPGTTDKKSKLFPGVYRGFISRIPDGYSNPQVKLDGIYIGPSLFLLYTLNHFLMVYSI
jgi:hypothetical protein